MKSPWYTLLLCLLCIFCFSNCHRCKPETTTVRISTNFVPYSLGSTFAMRNDSGVVIQFTDSIYRDYYSSSVDQYCRCCDVSEGQTIITHIRSDSMKVEITQAASPDGIDYFNVYLPSAAFGARVSGGALQSYSGTTVTTLPSLTVGGIVYPNVSKLETNTTTPSKAAHTIWYHPAGGLLKIQFNDGRVWELH